MEESHILDQLYKDLIVFSTKPPAQQRAIQKLEGMYANIPEGYIALVKESAETEFGWGTYAYLRIWEPEGCIEMTEAYHINKYLPGACNFADDGGGGFLTYLYKDGRLAIYLVRFDDIDIHEAIYIADSLADILCKGIGLNVICKPD